MNTWSPLRALSTPGASRLITTYFIARSPLVLAARRHERSCPAGPPAGRMRRRPGSAHHGDTLVFHLRGSAVYLFGSSALIIGCRPSLVVLCATAATGRRRAALASRERRRSAP